MGNFEGTVEKQLSSEAARDFKQKILRVFEDALEEDKSQFPLDVPRIFEYERPCLGGTVPVELYRAVRLFAFREALGSRISASILGNSGRSFAKKMGVSGLGPLMEALLDLAVVKPSVESRSDDKLVLTATECAACSGMPYMGEAICHFETGFIRGALEEEFGGPPCAKEVNCWGLGDSICRWEIKPDPYCEEREETPLDFAITVAGKAAALVDTSMIVRESNRQLRDAQRKLLESEKLRTDLIDMIVHDMRVPLTTIIGSLETLSDSLGNRVSQKNGKLLDLAAGGGQSLMRMIDHLLDISRIEQCGFELVRKQCAAEDMVRSALSQVFVMAKRRKHMLVASVGEGIPSLVVDGDRVTRVLVNLLTNAIKYTPRGGTITVSAEYVPDDEHVLFYVSDNGRGIPEEYHEKIFDKFFQAEAFKKHDAISSGVGLAFCKLVTEAHGGRIWVKSTPEEGSVFSFTIPVE